MLKHTMLFAPPPCAVGACVLHTITEEAKRPHIRRSIVHDILVPAPLVHQCPKLAIVWRQFKHIRRAVCQHAVECFMRKVHCVLHGPNRASCIEVVQGWEGLHHLAALSGTKDVPLYVLGVSPPVPLYS